MADYIVQEEDGTSRILSEEGDFLIQEESGGGTEYTKTGAGVSAFTASGADAVTSTESGAGVAAFAASGADAVTSAEAGAGVSAFTASGTSEHVVANDKYGAGVSGFTASGADAVTSSEAGTATGVLTGSGADVVEHAETGTGVAAFVGSGFTSHAYAKTGAGVLERTGTGDGRWTVVKHNFRQFINTGIGFDHVASAASEFSTSKSGAAKSTFRVFGRQGDGVMGSGVSARVASGTNGKSVNRINGATLGDTGATFGVGLVFEGRRETFVWTETGFTVRGLAASGADRMTFVETGTAISARVASGVPGKLGTAQAPFVASGADATTYVESGTATSPFVASGEMQPAGAAIAAFSGGGVLKGLYANDNFAAREVIDVPTGDIELDQGARSWLLAGATERATTETGEKLNTGSTAITRTLWWELQVPFPCIVELDVITRDSTVQQYGIAQRGTAVNATSIYADSARHFAQDGGRGIEANRFTTNTTGMFPDLGLSTRHRVVVQVDPVTPLVFNVGRNSSATPSGAQFHYDVSVVRREPPVNDGPSSSIFLDLAGGTVAYDTTGATGDGRWDWDQLDSLIDSPNSYRLAGDLFYAITPEEDCTFRYSVVAPTGGLTNSIVQTLIFEGTDPADWIPVVQDASATYPYAIGAGSIAAVDLEAGKTYTLALLQMKNSFDVGFSFVFTTPASRGVGSLTWEVLTTRPDNDDLADREVLSGTLPILTSVADARSATSEGGEPVGLNLGTARGVWYEYTPATAGWFSLTPGTPNGPSNFYPYFDVYRGTDFSDFEPLRSDSWIHPLWMRAGETYYIRLTQPPDLSFDNVSLTLDLASADAAANDDFADRVSLTGDSGEEVVDLTGTTSELGEPLMYYWNITQEPSAWYEWTPPYTGDYRFQLTSGTFSDFTRELAVYTGTSLATLTPVARYSTDPVVLEFHAQAGVPHQIQVGILPTTYSYEPHVLTWEPVTLATNVSKETATVISVGDVVVAHNGGAPEELPEGVPDIEALGYFSDDERDGRALWYRIDAVLDGDHVFTLDAPYWQAAAALLHDVDGTLEYALDFEDSIAVHNFNFDPELTVPLETGETYYLLVFGWSDLFDDVSASLWTRDMIPQGEFALTFSAANNVGDNWATDFVDADEIPQFNLNYFASYFYEGEEFGPLFNSVNVGGCRASSNVGATAEPGEPAHYPGFPATSSVWFYYKVGAGGDYEFWVEPYGPVPIVDPVLAVHFYASPETYAQLALEPVLAQSDNVDGLYPRTTVGGLEADTSLLIVVDGRDQGTFKLKWRRISPDPAPANDDFADAIEVTEGAPLAGTTVGATVECDEQPVAGWSEGPFGSVWYVYNPTEAGTAFANVTADDNFGNAPIMLDVYQGTAIADLVNITPAATYNNADNDATFGFPFSFTADAPVYFRLSSESDGAYNVVGTGGTFSLEVNVASTTPPVNDEPGDATDATGGDTPGNNDGAGFTPGEPDPTGGLLENTTPGGSSTWHRYVPDAPGFVDVYATTDGPSSQWPRIGMWEGASAQSGINVTALNQDPNIGPGHLYGGAMPCHFEVREGQTYWIQVIRRATQPFGDYTLHIDEYLEYNDWALGTDGFSSTTNSPTVSGDTITCTGNQAIADVLNVLPQYGTIDLGTDTPNWGREVRAYFEVRMIAGQVLRRGMWYGDDDWNFDNAASDDHVNLTMSRLGLLRGRDTSGTHSLAVSLAPGTKGENVIEATTENGECTSDVSLGQGRPQHNDGWVGVELVITAENYQYNDGTWQGAAEGSALTLYPLWTVRMLIDGQPVDGSCTYTGRQLRYLDFGMFRHPSMGPQGDPLLHDQRYVENNEAWTYEMRRLRVTNIVPREPYGTSFNGDAGVFEFDGFTSEVPWLTSGNRHAALAGPAITAAPDKPGWGAMHSVTLTPAAIRYGLSTGSRRWYGLSLDVTQMPSATLVIAGWGVTGVDVNHFTTYRLQSDGELRIKVYDREFCVAHLEVDQWCWVETYVDAEVGWDTRCTVYINGLLFGVYSNARTYSEIAAGEAGTVRIPARYATFTDLVFGPAGAGSFTHELYMTNTCSAIGNPDPVGPLQAVQAPAATETLPPGIPEEPDDTIDLLLADGGSHLKLYGWTYEDTDPGPASASLEGNGAPMPVIVPRFWEPVYELLATTPRLEANSGGGNAWSPIDEGRTRIADGSPVGATTNTQVLELSRFGNSVPVDAVVTGIEVRVRRRGAGASDSTVQLRKAGSPVGSNHAAGAWSIDWDVMTYGGETDLWGTTWSPQEVNALTFGVGISATGAGTAEIDQVTVRVYFLDEGGPPDIGRGSILAPAGLFNLYGDTAVLHFTASGSVGVSWPTGGWEPGGATDGTATDQWASLYPLWLWQARGDKIPSLYGTGTATDIRIVRNPLIYPRFAWSDDDGATYTWIYPDETDSVSRIGGDVGTGGPEAVFLDNTAALTPFMASPGGWSSGLNEDRPTSSPAYRYAFYYLAYTGDDTTETVIHATNLWARWRGYQNYPNTGSPPNSNFQAFAASPDGGVRRVGRYSGTGTVASPSTNRYTLPRAPDGEAWTQEHFNELEVRVGFNDNTSTNAFARYYNQSLGAALYALMWEVLVPAPADTPPAPCEQLIDLSMMRHVPSAGDVPATGHPPGVDLSDMKFTVGGDVNPTGTVGVDLSDVLFAPGSGAVEE